MLLPKSVHQQSDRLKNRSLTDFSIGQTADVLIDCDLSAAELRFLTGPLSSISHGGSERGHIRGYSGTTVAHSPDGKKVVY